MKWILYNTVKLWYRMSSLRLIRAIKADLAIALLTTCSLAKTDCNTLVSQKLFLIDYKVGHVVTLPPNSLWRRQSCSGAVIREGGSSKAGPIFCAGFAARSTNMEFARLACVAI